MNKIKVPGGRRQHGSVALTRLPEQLNDQLRFAGKAVYYFHKNGCPYCTEFAPIFDYVANQMYTNGSSFVSFFILNGPDAKAYMEPKFPNSVPHFPTILLQKEPNRIARWVPKERSYASFINILGQFFEIAGLHAYDLPIDRLFLQDKDAARWLFFYMQALPLVPYFSKAIPMVDILDGCHTFALQLLGQPSYASQLAAIDVEKMNRLDIPVPSLYDKETGKYLVLRDLDEYIYQK